MKKHHRVFLLLLFLFSPFTPFALEKNFTYQSLVDLIAKKNIRSIEELLPNLPEEFLSEYALVFKSRSLQGSSFKSPRVLLYGKEAKLILSFNGEKEQNAFYALETLTFDEENKSFHLREILFPAENKNQKIHISEDNPTTCLKCHGNPPRPIWDTYPLWPGAYGELYHAPFGEDEKKGLENFLGNYSKHPRYQYLKNVDRWNKRETFNPSAKNQYSGPELIPPNSMLTILLTRYNLQNIARSLKKLPSFSTFMYVLLASLRQECNHLEEFFPTKIRQQFLDRFLQFTQKSKNQNSQQEYFKFLRTVGGIEATKIHLQNLTSDESLNAFRFLLEEFLSISTGEWTLAIEKGTFDFSTPELSLAVMERSLLEEAATYDNKLKELSHYQDYSLKNNYCSYLKKVGKIDEQKIIDSFMNKKPLPLSMLSNTLDAPLLMQKCIGCHLYKVGPEIPFHLPTQLKELQKNSKYPRGQLLDEILYRLSPQSAHQRMPPGMILSAEEQLELEDYFKKIIGTSKDSKK